jgi:LCP family protein required for cell wall assembly
MDRPRDRQRPKTQASMDGFFSPRQHPNHRPSHIYIPPSTEQKHKISPAEAVHGATHYPPSYLKSSRQLTAQLPRVNEEPQNIAQKPTLDHTPRRSTKKRRRLPPRRIAALGVAFVLLIFLLGGSYVGWKFLKNTTKVFGGSIAGNIGDLFSTTRIKGEAQGRVNILLAGDSADDPGHDGANLTDSVMIASIDLKNNTAFLLSVPRDLWVQVPTMGHQKINAANEVTGFSAPGYPSGGMGQLEQIVTQDLGVPIDYYALIDYTAFRDAVNAVGGISINIQSGDPRGLFDPNISKADGGPLKLPNGVQTLDGQTALNLARARGDPAPSGIPSYGFPQSDFDRTMHQRQMLVALKAKASTIGVVSNPVKIGQLFDAVGNNVKTDLNLADVLRLVKLTSGVSNSAIQSVTYSETGTTPLLTGYTSPDGQEALIPKAGLDNFSQIKAYYQQLTSSNPVVKENANVVVLNGTNTSGIAKLAQTSLMAKGVDVTAIADASKNYASTTIIDNSKGKKPATLALLKNVYGNNVTTQLLEPYYTTQDFIVIIGTNTTLSPTASNTTQ